MRSSLLRFSVRRLMLAVLALGLGLHMVLTAWRVRGTDVHRHSFVLRLEGGRIADGGRDVRSPYWIRYIKGLSGRPWRGPGICCEPLGLHEFCWMRPYLIE